jgi:hypothetical protein
LTFQSWPDGQSRASGLALTLDGVTEAAKRPGDRWTDPDRAATFLGQLESRRSSIDQAMWQAPALTIAAQAFLLTVLTDSNVDDRARAWMLVAGVAACVAAILSLVRLRAREIEYSEAIAAACDKVGLPAPWPFGLDRKPAEHKAGRVDRAVRSLGAWQRLPTVYLFWIAALMLFVVADVVAYYVTT